MTFREFYNATISESAAGLKYKELLGAATITMRQKYPFFDDLFRRLTVISVKNFDADATPEEVAQARKEGFVQIPRITTMAVDAKGNIYINVDFATTQLTYQQVIGTLCHEVMHIALHHMSRTGSRNHQLHNIATDLVINHQLTLDEIPLPDEGIIPEENGDYTFDGEVTKSGNPETINVANKMSEEVYAEIEALLKDSVKGDQGPPKPVEPGDIIWVDDPKSPNKGKYGKVVKVSGDQVHVEEMPKGAAIEEVRTRRNQ